MSTFVGESCFEAVTAVEVRPSRQWSTQNISIGTARSPQCFPPAVRLGLGICAYGKGRIGNLLNLSEPIRLLRQLCKCEP